MVKSNYRYHLANGDYLEYSLSPGCSLVAVVDELVSSYYSLCYTFHEVVWVRPEIASALIKEAYANYRSLIGNLPNGIGVLKLNTISGPVTIVAKDDLEWPIFYGSEQELKDNSFSASMEDILCE